MISKVGTPVYMAPQILCSDIYKKYTHKCDIWSIGLLTYELITGDIPWKKSLTSNRKKSFEEIKKFIEGGIQYP